MFGWKTIATFCTSVDANSVRGLHMKWVCVTMLPLFIFVIEAFRYQLGIRDKTQIFGLLSMYPLVLKQTNDKSILLSSRFGSIQE